VLIEARAFGCPVIGTTISGIPDSIQNEYDGLLVKPDDPIALATAISRIACDEDLRFRLIQGGIERARHNTIEDFADAIIDEVRLASSCLARTHELKGTNQS
jgi:glycosyltransferase involved in cell wall biosynthesis